MTVSRYLKHVIIFSLFDAKMAIGLHTGAYGQDH